MKQIQTKKKLDGDHKQVCRILLKNLLVEHVETLLVPYYCIGFVSNSN